MRKILLGAMVVAALAVTPSALADQGPGYSDGGCGYTQVGSSSTATTPTTVTPVAGTDVGVQAAVTGDTVLAVVANLLTADVAGAVNDGYFEQDQGMSGKAFAEVGACLNTNAASTFHGGAVGVGGGLNNPTTTVAGVPMGVTRLCPVNGAAVPVPTPVGVYAVADGNNNNMLVPQTSGYAGLSNYETGSNEGCPPEPNNGSGTNSGGSVGITSVPVTGTPVGVYVPVPLIVCGNDSGPNWSGSGRDGCYID